MRSLAVAPSGGRQPGSHRSHNRLPRRHGGGAATRRGGTVEKLGCSPFGWAAARVSSVAEPTPATTPTPPLPYLYIYAPPSAFTYIYDHVCVGATRAPVARPGPSDLVPTQPNLMCETCY